MPNHREAAKAFYTAKGWPWRNPHPVGWVDGAFLWIDHQSEDCDVECLRGTAELWVLKKQ